MTENNSQLHQWPVQLRLVPAHAPYFNDANLLLAADCTAYAYARFHEDFIKGNLVFIACPKLDATDYTEKLTEILRQNEVRKVTLVRMEVPCCGDLEAMVKKAIQQSGKALPLTMQIISLEGKILKK